MLNTATPTLQIKTNGITLSQIKTMEIAIRSANSFILKGNSDIEVDNDIISTFLTKEESEEISNGNCNISIMAYNLDDEDVSDKIKVMWVKRGSMSKASGSGSDADLSNYYTRQEVDILVREIPKGQDGFSPSAKVEKEGKISTITIIDKAWKTTADVLDGKDGKDGLTPYVGENGNWYVGLEDTGMPSRGEKGESGGLMSETEIQDMIDESFVSNMGGAKIAQDSEGKWGYIPPGADAVIPFKGAAATGISFMELIGTYVSATVLADGSIENPILVSRSRDVIFSRFSQ